MIHIIAQSLGYLATLFLALSLLVNNDIKFRWLNSFGGVSFVIYGLLINEWPIILTNGILVCINFYYLYKLYQTQENFDIHEFKKDDPLIAKFLNFYKTDVTGYFPDFNLTETDGNIRFVVLRDLVIANIFVAKLDENGNAVVEINYTVPKYRDFKIAKFLFQKEKNLMSTMGVKVVQYNHVHNKNHANFLLKTGFTTETDNNGTTYRKSL